LTDHGPIIKLCNPQWTQAAPYEDLPVMVFTPAQWVKVQAEGLGVGAAPVPPSELGHNSTYVFALPARYNRHGSHRGSGNRAHRRYEGKVMKALPGARQL
jgi:hypothetical protein